MFFQLKKTNGITIKIAPYLKLPYVCETNNPFYKTTRVEYHGKIHEILSFQESVCYMLRHRTYFINKNNVILYHNHVFSLKGDNNLGPDQHKLFWFMVDIRRNIYLAIEFSKINYFTFKNASLLIGLKNKFYLVSRDLYKTNSAYSVVDWRDNVAIIDLSSGEKLYFKGRNSGATNAPKFLDLYYPIANRIVPVLQFDSNTLYLHLVDISHNKVNTLSKNIDEIKLVVIDIVNKDDNSKDIREIILQDNFEYISAVKISRVDYLHDSNGEGAKYVKGIDVYFEILIKGNKYEYKINLFGISIICGHKSVECYLNLKDVSFELSDGKTITYKDKYRETMILLEEITFTSEIPEIYLPNVLYSNKCYDIIHRTEDGIALTNKKLDIIWSDPDAFSNFSMYRHKNYLFIFKVPNDRYPVCLIVIDLKGDILYPFISKGDFKRLLIELLGENVNYISHHFKTKDKIAFLYYNLKYIFTIELSRLADKIDRTKQDKCQEGYYAYVEDFIEIFDINQLMNKAISHTYNVRSVDRKFEILSYYIDRILDNLYFTVKYKIGKTNYIGLFEFILSEKSKFLRLITYYPHNLILHHKNKNKRYINLVLCHSNKNKRYINISSLNIQRIYHTNTFNNNLEITCNLNAVLINIGNNRISTRALPQSEFVEQIICYNLGDCVHLTWEDRYSPKPKEQVFVLSQLNLVNKISVLTL